MLRFWSVILSLVGKFSAIQKMIPDPAFSTLLFFKKSVGFDLDKKVEKDVFSVMMFRGLPYAMFPKDMLL